MTIRCPLCGREIPEEDRDIASSPGQDLVAQVLCRPCGKTFTICEEKGFLEVRRRGKSIHPENR